ncbi:hypothetical protein EAF04_004163 [Stromatinia cepivora]|nr:hypothetical protein EAF04_004163 [Stromatinia cepivora]
MGLFSDQAQEVLHVKSALRAAESMPYCYLPDLTFSDPFSVSVSVLTVIGACVSISKALNTTIQNYKDAPSGIAALSKEVEDVTLILREVNNQQLSPVSGSSLDVVIINRADGKLAELKDFIAKLGVLHTHGRPRRSFEKLKWTKSKEKSRELLTTLRDVKINLGLLINNSALSQGIQIQSSVDTVSNDISSLSLTNESQHDAISRHLSHHNRQLVEKSRDLNALVPVRDHYHREILNILKYQVQSSEHNGALIREVMEFMQASQPQGIGTAQATYDQRSEPESQSQSTSDIAVQLKKRAVKANVCNPACPCGCHKQRRFRTPRFLDFFMGALSVGFSGLPLVSCNNSACWSCTSMTTSATYLFPRWFLNRALFVAVANSMEPTVSLEVLRIVASEAWDYIGIHQSPERNLWAIMETRGLFEKRLASPNDIDFDQRVSLLHYSITQAGLDFCKFLLDMGAEIDLWTEPTTSYPGKTANEAAHLLYLSRGRYEILGMGCWLPLEFEFDEASLRKLFEIFHLSPEEFLVEQGFPRLHKAVLRGDIQIVRRELEVSTKDIHMVDQYEYSASFWAAIRLDTHCLEVLLEHGAIDGESLIALAFLYTANHHRQNARLECMRTLIKYGKSRLGAKYLSWAAIALHMACRHGHYGCLPPQVPLLLEAGANPHTCDRCGQSPLYHAVLWSNHSVIKALLDAGLSTRILTRQNFWTVLTNAHKRADGVTLQFFISAKLKVTGLSLEDWL